MEILYPIISVILVSSVGLFIAIPFLLKKRISDRTLLALLSVSVGVILATVFLDFFPEILEHGYHVETGIAVLAGFLVMFILENIVHRHHTKKCERGHCKHSHAYHLAPVNLVGDGIHNFIDGLVLAGAYAANTMLGIAATISIIFHEIPQEIADLGVLIYSGLSKKKAVIYNLLSALTAVIGTIIGIIMVGRTGAFNEFILPFAAGNFIYIAASNLVPQLHQHCKLKDMLIHVTAILCGVAIIVLVTMHGPAHVH